MHLTCPQCHTEYEVPDAALIGRARTLRCGDCGTKFTAPALPEPLVAAPEPLPEIPPHEDIVQQEIAAEPEASFEPAAEEIAPGILATEPEAVVPDETPDETVAPLSATRTIPAPPKFTVPPPPPASKPNRALGISILIVVLAIAIVLAEHRAIGHAWPPSLRLFNALGLH